MQALVDRVTVRGRGHDAAGNQEHEVKEMEELSECRHNNEFHRKS